MTNARNPHAPYIEAVVDAMPAGCTPTNWWVSDAETASDGETCTLSAVLSWDGDVNPDEYPDGLLLCWDLDREWQYAAMRPDGSNDSPEDLPLPLWAAPKDVAATVQALLSGEDPPPSDAQWRNDAVLAAVRAWNEEV